MFDTKNISVIVQGAIDKINTKKCLISIRKYLPNAEIILSTWEGSDTNNLEYDILVENKDPGNVRHDYTAYNISRSRNNFNRQLISTRNGIEKATKKYVLKIRSDLILKNSNFLNYWEKYNIRNEKYRIFEHRVLCSVLYSREYSCQSGNGFPIPFHPSDFWFFGLNEDVKDYFVNCPLKSDDEAGNWNCKYPSRLPYPIALFRYAPEQQFCYNWVKKYFPNIQFDDWSDWNEENIELSNNVLYNNFIFLSYEESGIYSEKHKKSENYKDIIQGLITYKHFQKQYKKYCDNNYVVKENVINKCKNKLIKHYRNLIFPTKRFFHWVSEIFSVIFYLFCFVFSCLTRCGKND